jgi:hypothetical protein
MSVLSRCFTTMVPRDWRRAFVCLVLSAFVAQSLATQGHMHWAVADADSVVADALGAGHAPGGGSPVKGDQNNCPVCHATSIAGAIAVPSAPALWVPSLSTLIKPRDEREIVVERFAAHWRSRAPPAV